MTRWSRQRLIGQQGIGLHLGQELIWSFQIVSVTGGGKSALRSEALTRAWTIQETERMAVHNSV